MLAKLKRIFDTDKEVVAIYKEIENDIRGLSAIVGADVLDPHFKYGYRYGISIIVLLTYFTCFLKYLVYYKDNMEVLILAIPTVGIWFQGAYKFFLVIHKRVMIYRAINVIRKLYVEAIRNDKNRKTIHSYLKLLRVIHYAFKCLYTFAGITVLLLTVILSFIYHIRTYAFGIILPILDPELLSTFIANLCVQGFILYWGLIGNAAADVGLVFLLLNTVTFTKVFNTVVTDLSDNLRADYFNRQHKLFFRNIIMMHLEIHEYIQEINSIFSSLVFVQLGTISLEVVVSLVGVLLNHSWFTGYCLLVIGLTQLLMFSVLGTIVEIMNDNVATAVKNCNWYEMPVKYQKYFILIIMNTQAAPSMNIGKVAPLNVDSGSTILKFIYNTFLMMVNCFT